MTNFQYPDRITTNINVELEVTPKHASLSLIIEGESNFQKKTSFKKSKEIAILIQELSNIDYDHTHIQLKSIKIKEQTSKIIKSSTARFTLILDKIPLDHLPKVLSICSHQKNIEIIDIEYEFGIFKEEKPILIKDACAEAKAQGRIICDSFGIDLLGIYSMNCQWSHPNQQKSFDQPFITQSMYRNRSIDRSNDEMDGLDFISNHKSLLKLTLTTEFRVSDFK